MLRAYTASLTRVIDADTFEMTVDLGFRIYHSITVRLLGVDAPERHSEGGEGAIEFVDQWFFHKRGPYTIWTEEQDSWGRWLADVVNPDGFNLAQNLMAAGHAVAYEP